MGAMGNSLPCAWLFDLDVDYPAADHFTGRVAGRICGILATGHTPNGLACLKTNIMDFRINDSDQHYYGHANGLRSCAL